MKIICAKQKLIENINIVSKAVSSKTTLPILECILLTASELGFRMVANDLEMGVETASIEAEIQEHGGIALEAKMFSEIVRKMPEGDITIATDDKNVATISLGKVELKILGQNSEEFPCLPTVEKDVANEIPAVEFRNMIRQTIFSISLDESKPVFTGELLEISPRGLNLVAVDGFRISLRCFQWDENSGDNVTASVVVPGKTLNELSKILPAGQEDALKFYITDKHIMFETDEYTFISRLIDGEFLKYKQSFNTDYSILAQVERQRLLESLERATLLSRDQKKNPIQLAIGQNQMVVTSQTEMGTAYDEIEIRLEGEESLEIAFNPRYLIDVLRVVEAEELQIQFTTSLSPCIIKGVENNNFQYLILPLRLKQ